MSVPQKNVPSVVVYLDQKLDTIHGGNFKSKLPKATFAKAFFILSIDKNDIFPSHL